jgi:preprotein translocase subunit SecA
VPILVAKGLDGPERRVPLQYTAPSVDGEAGRVVTTTGTGGAVAAEKDGQTFPGTARNAQCPCGSGKKYKLCHGKNEE